MSFVLLSKVCLQSDNHMVRDYNVKLTHSSSSSKNITLHPPAVHNMLTHEPYGNKNTN